MFVNKGIKCDKSMDKNVVKKVLTYKSGKFVFSKKFSEEKLSHLLIEAGVLYSTISELPILPNLASQLEEELIRRSIFTTAAIEGNPLTEEEVANVISEPNNRKQKVEREITNLKSAYDFVKFQPVSLFALTETQIKQIHSIITDGIEYKENIPGQYRSHKVKVGNAEHGGIYTPPKCLDDIKLLMVEFIEWINSKELMETPIIRAGLAHYYLGLIHPFADGNGRTARLVEALLLNSAGIKYAPVMLSNFYYRNLDDYFWAFSKSIKNKEDITPFLEFILRGFVESLKEIKGRITFFIRKFTLREYYAYLRARKEITERQHDLLIILLDYSGRFRLKDLFAPPFNILYRNVSERTVRRDLEGLHKKNLLTWGGGSLLMPITYELNFRVLG